MGAGAAAAAAMTGIGSTTIMAAEAKKVGTKGRINQSVCKWCYGKEPLDKFAAYCSQIGIKSVELLGHDGPVEWEHHPDGLRVTFPEKSTCPGVSIRFST